METYTSPNALTLTSGTQVSRTLTTQGFAMKITKGLFRQTLFFTGQDAGRMRVAWILYIRDEAEAVVDPSDASEVLPQREKGALMGSGYVSITEHVPWNLMFPLKNIMLQDDQDLQFNYMPRDSDIAFEEARLRFKFRRM